MTKLIFFVTEILFFLFSLLKFWTDTLSLKGKRLGFYGRADTYVSLMNTIPELRQFTACIDLVFVDDKSSDWMGFSSITNNTFLGRRPSAANTIQPGQDFLYPLPSHPISMA